ncbi:BgTH12-03254 [Blumeria graminis f. sp. triticale]|uniref:DASH complex subunit DAD3 n=1 Tax=Blumeria graminis f. sp. triticale TaxID=1689686 RepID=A0A9W4DKS8_BLUGR|nr:BgTH12-03254 [Blumeria graminis f. sp. triticale]
MESIDPSTPTAHSWNTQLTVLEQDVLDEYARLDENLRTLACKLDELANCPTTEIMDGLRQLERKSGLVYTLLKASVYSIVLQQEMYAVDNAETP